MKTVINLNSDVYYKGIYWNDFQKIQEYMCENFTGDKSKYWIEDFKERYAVKPFEHALFINCGDGRFERQFIDENIAKKVTAFDISPDLISQAKKERGRRNITYLIVDANKVKFGEDQFDLVVNIAALHHVQYINRLCYILARAIKPGGYLVNFDYIGPHRNQYPFIQWLLAKSVNGKLSADVRQTPMLYPHLPTMLDTDPTEAIHSDLIIRTILRYFTIKERHDTGGGIAYLLLTHNAKLNRVSQIKLNRMIKKVLKYDQRYTRAKLVPTLFSYFIASPNKKLLIIKKRINSYQRIENTREKAAFYRRGVYSFIDYLRLVHNCPGLGEQLFLIKEYLRSVFSFR